MCIPRGQHQDLASTLDELNWPVPVRDALRVIVTKELENRLSGVRRVARWVEEPTFGAIHQQIDRLPHKRAEINGQTEGQQLETSMLNLKDALTMDRRRILFMICFQDGYNVVVVARV